MFGLLGFFFFFKQKTAYEMRISDWSSDVCASDLDIERVRAIYAAVEGRALLRLDANQGWTAKQAVYAMQALEDAGVRLELLEQPVKAQDIDGLKYVTDRVHTPVMADESVFGPLQVIDLI